MGYNEPEWKQSLCYESGTKCESPMNGKGSRDSSRAGLALHHMRELSSSIPRAANAAHTATKCHSII
ncbi:hypothetical protein DL93DRAFT_2091724 [Clavulina sp. PMI_390]|nr:hypothetical protein DL93DRAFT_2091724 [Clavulina sp. PMI_390]